MIGTMNTTDYNSSDYLDYFIEEYASTKSPLSNSSHEEMSLHKHVEFSTLMFIAVISAIIKLLLMLWAMMVNTFLVCLICAARRLRTRTNMNVINFAAMNTLYLIFELLIMLAGMRYYFIFELTATSLELYFVFVEMMAIDYVLVAYCPKFFKIYEKSYKWIVAVLYGTFVIKGLISWSISVSKQRYTLFGVPADIIYLIALLSVLIICIVNVKKSTPSEANEISYAFIVPLTILLLWLPLELLALISNNHYPRDFANIIDILTFIMTYVVTLIPTVVVIVLYKKDKNFSMAFRRLFKRSLKNYRNENIDDEPNGEDFDDNQTVDVASTVFS